VHIKATLTLAFILIFESSHFAQTPGAENKILKGSILDNQNNQPLAYVSVGVLNKSEGTLTDSAGNFSFEISQENLEDTLQMSSVGYFPKKIAVKDYIKSNATIVKLEIKITELAEVIVTNMKTNTEIVGRQTSSKLTQVSIHNKTSAAQTIGSEMGMRYKTSRINAILKDFNFYISANNFNSIKFRVNIYSVKDELPDTLIYNKQIFATVDNFKTGWTKLDLQQYGIQVNNDFIVTIQWVESKMDKKEKPITIVPVVMTMFSKNCYVRIASQDKWKKMGLGMSNYITLAY
jgi:CarboxypepD_reg-like domain